MKAKLSAAREQSNLLSERDAVSIPACLLFFSNFISTGIGSVERRARGCHPAGQPSSGA